MGQFRATGSSGQSHWLVLAATIADRPVDMQLPAWKRELLASLHGRRKDNLHFRDLDHYARLHVTQQISTIRVGFMAILAHKPTIDKWPGFAEKCKSEKNILYKYMLRLLLEKITDTISRVSARDGKGAEIARVIFSRRGGMDYVDFRSYLTYLRNLQSRRGSHYPIKWQHLDLDAMEAADHSKWAGLQIADVCASSFFQAVEQNRYGMTEPRYAQLLRPRMIRSTLQQALYYGVRPLPGLGNMSLTNEQREFFVSWKKDG